MSNPGLLRQQCYIGGVWCGADSGATPDITNPATGQAIGTIPDMRATEARRAIDAANVALEAEDREGARAHLAPLV